MTRVGKILKNESRVKPQLDFTKHGNKLVVLVTTGYVKEFNSEKEVSAAIEMIKRNQNDTVSYLKDTNFKEY